MFHRLYLTLFSFLFGTSSVLPLSQGEEASGVPLHAMQTERLPGFHLHEPTYDERIEELEQECEMLRQTVQHAYDERDIHFVFSLHLAHRLGLRTGILTDYESDPEWQSVPFIELPVGQVHLHFHQSESPYLKNVPHVEWHIEGQVDRSEQYYRMLHPYGLFSTLTNLDEEDGGVPTDASASGGEGGDDEEGEPTDKYKTVPLPEEKEKKTNAFCSYRNSSST